MVKTGNSLSVIRFNQNGITSPAGVSASKMVSCYSAHQLIAKCLSYRRQCKLIEVRSLQFFFFLFPILIHFCHSNLLSLNGINQREMKIQSLSSDPIGKIGSFIVHRII